MQTRKLLLTLGASGVVASAASATVISSPSVVGGSNAFGQAVHNAGTYSSANAVNGNINEYASAGQGANTFLEFQWGSAVTFDRVILVNRNSEAGGDRFSQVTLTYDVGSDTIATDSAQARSQIYSVGSTSTQNVRFDVDVQGTGGPVANNTGLKEAIFLNTPTGTYADAYVVGGVTAYNSATPHAAGGYTADNAVDGYVGHDSGSDYSSNGLGLSTFVDFDLGAVTKIIGFDMIDRWGDADQTRGFDLIFSNTSDFSVVIDTKSYSKGANTVAFGDDFNYVEAQYVRFDVTNSGTGNNKGISEMIFYGTNVPEPGSLALIGLGGLLIARRRRD